jgi:hypothetical protein
LEGRCDDRVDPIAEAFRSAVPDARDCVSLGDHLLLILVVEDELELGELVE